MLTTDGRSLRLILTGVVSLAIAIRLFYAYAHEDFMGLLSHLHCDNTSELMPGHIDDVPLPWIESLGALLTRVVMVVLVLGLILGEQTLPTVFITVSLSRSLPLTPPWAVAMLSRMAGDESSPCPLCAAALTMSHASQVILQCVGTAEKIVEVLIPRTSVLGCASALNHSAGLVTNARSSLVVLTSAIIFGSVALTAIVLSAINGKGDLDVVRSHMHLAPW